MMRFLRIEGFHWPGESERDQPHAVVIAVVKQSFRKGTWQALDNGSMPKKLCCYAEFLSVERCIPNKLSWTAGRSYTVRDDAWRKIVALKGDELKQWRARYMLMKA